jgi:hypothetical protein
MEIGVLQDCQNVYIVLLVLVRVSKEAFSSVKHLEKKIKSIWRRSYLRYIHT